MDHAKAAPTGGIWCALFSALLQRGTPTKEKGSNEKKGGPLAHGKKLLLLRQLEHVSV